MENILVKSINELTIRVDLDADKNQVIALFTGTAANEDAPELESTLEHIRSQASGFSLLVFNVFVIADKVTWQHTSLRAMVGISPNCTVVGAEGGCCHGNTRHESESHFAPTGKGVNISRTFCEDCNMLLSESNEYFD